LRLLRLLCDKCGITYDKPLARALAEPTHPEEIIRKIQEHVEQPQ